MNLNANPWAHDNNSSDFNCQFRIFFEDTDAGGIVYYANYLKYFERARSEWLRSYGLGQFELANAHRLFFVVRKAYTDYLSPARLDDQITVTVKVEKLGKVAVEFYQEIYRGQELLVHCRTKVGCISADSMKPMAIPAHVQQQLSRPVRVQ